MRDKKSAISSRRRGSFSFSRIAHVVCVEYITAIPLFTPDSATNSLILSVISINSGAFVVSI